MYKRKLSILLVLVLLFTMNFSFASDDEQTVPPQVEVPKAPSYSELPKFPGEITTTPPATDPSTDTPTETPTQTTPTAPTADASLENVILSIQKSLEALKSMDDTERQSAEDKLEDMIQAAVKAAGTIQISSQVGVPTTVDKAMLLEKALSAEKLSKELSLLAGDSLNKKIETSIRLSFGANAESGMELELPDLKEVFEVVDTIEIETPMGSVALHKDMFADGLLPSRISIGVVPKESLPIEYENYKVMSFVIHSGNETVDFFLKPVVVSIPFAVEEGVDSNALTAFYLDDDGLATPVPGYYDNGVFVFKTNHFSKYFIASNQVDFSDVKNEWFAPFVKGMAAKGIIVGRTNGLFDPDANVTRAEFVALISRVLNYGNSTVELPFGDVNDNDWFYAPVKMLYSAGILDHAEKLDPNEAITREEMGILLGKTLIEMGYNPAQDLTLNRFTDMKTTEKVSGEFISVAVRNNVLVGYGDLFLPKEKMTRAHAATVISILLSK
jgi:hypothetical protein